MADPMEALLDRMATKTSTAKVTKGGNNFRPGRYLLELEQALMKEKGPDDGGEIHSIVEFRIIEAVATAATFLDGKPCTPNPVGSSASFVLKLHPDKNNMAAGNLKTFLLTLLEMSLLPEEFNEAQYKKGLKMLFAQKTEVSNPDGTKTISEGNGFKFARIKLEAYEKWQKVDKNKVFTHMRWEAVKQDFEAISKRRAAGEKTASEKEQEATKAA